MSAAAPHGLPDRCFAPHAVAAIAAEDPERVVITYVGSHRVRAGDLLERSQQLARRLAAAGATAGTRVATFVPNGPLAHELFLAVAWLGAVEVPLNPLLTGALLEHQMVEAQVEVLITVEALADRVRAVARPGSLGSVVLSDGAPMGDEVALAALSPADVALPGPTYRDVAAVMFTSGTTGPSKGVVVPWATVYQFWSWVPDDAVGPDDVVYCALSMAHNSGRSCANYAISRGAHLVVRERFSGSDFWSDVRTHGCTVAALVGPMTQVLQSAPAHPDDADNPLVSVIAGPLIAEIESFKRRFGVRVATSYGMTETGITLATGWDHGPPASCGRPRTDYPWTEVRVADEWDQPVPAGQIGELLVRSAEPWSLNLGYFARPEATVAAWRNGWFHTGDAFRVDEHGWYHLVDRMKDTIRRRGENISSYELESVANTHPLVVESAAVAVPAPLGEDDVLLVLEVTDPTTIDPAEFVEWLRPLVPRYMVPRYVQVTTALPRNQTTQRIRKQELRDRGVVDGTWDSGN